MSLISYHAPSKRASYVRRSTAGTDTWAARPSGVSSPSSARTACSLNGRRPFSNWASAPSTRASPSRAARYRTRTYSRSARPGCCAASASYARRNVTVGYSSSR
jgi:hypothetical protein